MGNNPVRFTDPSGHCRIDDDPEDCLLPDKSNAPEGPDDPNLPSGGGGNSCDGPNPSVVCIDDETDIQSDLSNDLVLVYLGGINPGGIHGVLGDAGDPPVIRTIKGTKSLGVIEILQLLNLIFASNAPSGSPDADVFLAYQLLSNGQIDSLVITVDNHSGASNVYIEAVVIETEVFQEKFIIQPQQAVVVPPGTYGQMSFCNSCLEDGVSVISTDALPINSGLGVTVSPIIGVVYDLGGTTGASYTNLDFPYTIVPR